MKRCGGRIVTDFSFEKGCTYRTVYKEGNDYYVRFKENGKINYKNIKDIECPLEPLFLYLYGGEKV